MSVFEVIVVIWKEKSAIAHEHRSVSWVLFGSMAGRDGGERKRRVTWVSDVDKDGAG